MNRPPIPTAPRRRRAGFTLVELLLVMVILAVLAAIVIPKFSGRGEDAKIQGAKTQIAQFGTSLDLYETDNGSYPTTAQGLWALREKPTAAPEPRSWKGPYLKGEVPDDPWGTPYVYRSPGTVNRDGYDLISAGPDAKEGTEDDVFNP